MPKLILFNKPYGVLSQFRSEAGSVSLANFINMPGFYPAGRLDKDSEGLLLLTDNGQLQHHIAHPKYKEEKVYWVQLDGVPDKQSLKILSDGVMLKDGKTLPANAREIIEPKIWPRDPPIRYRANIPTSWIELGIREGKNRQVRRMTAAVGFPTLRLIRYRIGQWTIDDIPPGKWKLVNVTDTIHSPKPSTGKKKAHAGKSSRHRRRHH